MTRAEGLSCTVSLLELHMQLGEKKLFNMLCSTTNGLSFATDHFHRDPYFPSLMYLVLDSDAIFERIDTSVCIGIMPTCDAGPSLLGAFQQTNHRLLFDVKSLSMSFVPEKC